MPVGRGLGFLAVAGVAWGTSGATAALTFASSGLGPVALTFWRTAGGLVLLLAVRALRPRRPRAPRGSGSRAWLPVLVNGL
ncbi:EamA family transporter, partial [Streptomyces sp. NPDC049577]